MSSDIVLPRHEHSVFYFICILITKNSS